MWAESTVTSFTSFTSFTGFTGLTGASAAAVTGWDINAHNNNAGLTFYGSASPAGVFATGLPGTTAVAMSLAFGALISSAGRYNQFQTTAPGFQLAGTHYAGFRFLNETTAVLNYGWLQISNGSLPSPDGGFPAFITAYGNEDSGMSVTAVAPALVVPEPEAYALMFSGLAVVLGSMASRRRKTAV